MDVCGGPHNASSQTLQRAGQEKWSGTATHNLGLRCIHRVVLELGISTSVQHACIEVRGQARSRAHSSPGQPHISSPRSAANGCTTKGNPASTWLSRRRIVRRRMVCLDAHRHPLCSGSTESLQASSRLSSEAILEARCDC